MNRKNLISLIILDLVVMIMAAGLMLYRYNSLSVPISRERIIAAVAAERKKTDPAFTTVKAETPRERREPKNTSTRNVGFTFRHSKIKKAQIIGDFNNWIPQNLKKGDGHNWSITIPLAPGEYAYNFVIDGKPKRDPNNPKICDAGRGFPNSYLKVKPLEENN